MASILISLRDPYWYPMPMRIIFAGLPGVGKPVLAGRLAAVFLRIDRIEQGLRDLCGLKVQGEGYRLAYWVAEENLRLGRDVVADACNLLELTPRQWGAVARDADAEFVKCVRLDGTWDVGWRPEACRLQACRLEV